MQILVIEEESEAEKVASFLKEAGYNVDFATNGVSGLEKIYSQHPNLLILNAFLPEIDGHQLCYLLRGDEEYAGISIIVLEPEDKKIFLDESLKIEAIIKKPYSQEDLLSCVAEIIKGKKKEGGEKVSKEIERLRQKVVEQEAKIKELFVSIDKFKISKDAIAKVNELLNRQIQELTFAHKIDEQLAFSFMDYDQTAETLFKIAREAVEFDVGFALCYGKAKGGKLYLDTKTVLGESYYDDLWANLSEKVPFLEKEKVQLSRTGIINESEEPYLHIFLLFSFPLEFENSEERTFVCGISRNENNEFTEKEKRLFENIVKHGRLGFVHAIFFEELERTFFEIMTSVVETIEGKQKYQAGHSGRVAMYAKAVCESLGLDRRQTELIHDAALLHDVGKMAVPEDVLNKSGRLTKEEFLQISTHPKVASDMLSSFKTFQEMLPIIFYHHEKFGGGGYSRLKGEQIPFGARILAVCDAFDALTTDRPYRKALSADQAIAEIKEGAGTQFDPQVVKAFLKGWLEHKIAA
jgi:putative nucleotidyltransferase with HDIG domain